MYMSFNIRLIYHINQEVWSISEKNFDINSGLECEKWIF